jgi:hypothetical protein
MSTAPQHLARSALRRAMLLFGWTWAALLAACGGGGDEAAPVPQGPQPNVATGFAAEEQAAYTLLRDERSRCGFGAPSPNSLLAQAARNHANWLVTNDANSHEETPGTPGFTGKTALERLQYVGYPVRAVAESIGWGSVRPVASGVAVRALRGLMAVPYHAIGVVAFNLPEVGLALGPSDGYYAPLVVELAASRGAAAGPVVYPPNSVKTYPCEGTTGVLTRTLAENPNPIPGRDLSTDPTGSSIIVSVASGNTLTLGAGTLVHVASGQAVEVLPPVTASNDPNRHLAPNTGFYLPAQPLAPNSRYQFTFRGSNAGVPFTQSFTYTTGSD